MVKRDDLALRRHLLLSVQVVWRTLSYESNVNTFEVPSGIAAIDSGINPQPPQLWALKLR